MASELHVDAIKHSGGTSALTIDSSGNLTASANVHYAGAVLQVQSSQVSAWSPTSSTSAIASGLSVTITPKFNNSKVLVLVSMNGLYTQAAGTYAVYHLYKGGSIVNFMSSVQGQNAGSGYEYGACLAHQYLDSPATTSATTYEVYYLSAGTSGSVGFNNYAAGGNNTTHSTITAMEIAQ